MRLSLIHGRSHPEERLNGWGFDGPVVDGVAWVSMTYVATLRIGFADATSLRAAQHITGWDAADELVLEARIEDELVVVPSAPNPSGRLGAWFGDWSVSDDVEGFIETLPLALSRLAAGERAALFRRLGVALRPHAPEAADALEFPVEG